MSPCRALIALALVLLLAGAEQCFGAPADDLLAVGKKAFGDGQYQLAVTSFQRIQDEHPEFPRVDEAGYLLGVSLFYAGDWSACLSQFSLLGITHPASGFNSRSAYWIGAASLRLGNYQTAFDNLTAFLQHEAGSTPYRLSSRLYRAMALEGLGRDSEAAAGFRELLGDPSASAYAAEATYRLAGTELRAGRPSLARDLYGRVLLDFAGSPFLRDSVFFAGECDLSLGNFAEAEKRYATLLSLYPDSPWIEAATFRLADVAWRQGKPNALRQLDDFLTRFPGGTWSGSARRLRGDIFMKQKRPAEAIEEYAQAVKVLADGTEKQSAWYSMALAQMSIGDKDKAADSLAKAGSGGSADVAEKASFERAVLLAGDGRSAEAIEALRSFLKSFPSSARAEEAGRLLGSLLQKQGDRAAAWSTWNFLVQHYSSSPSMPAYLHHRGMSELAQGRWAQALDDFQRVVKDHPSSAWAGSSGYAIGFVYAQRGEYPRALPYFRSQGTRGRLAAAITLFDMGRFDEAAAAFRALQTTSEPTASPGTLALYVGKSLYRAGRLADAASRLADAAATLLAEDSPLGADAQYWRGWSLLRLRKPGEAYGAFLAVAETYPSDPRRLEALFRAGVCQGMQADDTSAVLLYEQVIEKQAAAFRDANAAGTGRDDPASSAIVEQAMYEKAQALARLGKQQESAESLEALAGAFPGGRLAALALYARGERARLAQRFGDARADFQRVARDFPRSPLAPQAMYWSAESLRLSGDARGAVDAFWSCLGPQSARALTTQVIEGFAAALNDLADVETAQLYAQKARDADGIPAEAGAGIVLACADLLLPSAPEEARAFIDTVRKSAPPEPYAGEASLLLAKYAGLRADWGRSLDILGSLEGSRVDDIGARAGLEKGRTLEAMGRTSEAVDEYLKIAYLFPDLGSRGAEGMANAVRLSRMRGETDRASKIEQALRKAYPSSPWLDTLSPD